MPGVNEIESTLRGVVRTDDVLVLLGAGDIGSAAATLAEGGRNVRGRLMRNVSMARMTTWGTGGRAERVYVPADVEDLADFLAGLGPRDEVLWVGLGSNLLVRDGGSAEWSS